MSVENSGNDAGAVELVSKFEKWLDYVSSPDCSAPYGQEPEIDEFRDLHGSVALVNPDGPAAASLIERLTASLVEVRDALAQCYIEKQSADGDPRLQRADEALAMTKGGGNVG